MADAAGQAMDAAPPAPPQSMFQKLAATAFRMFLMYQVMGFFRQSPAPSTVVNPDGVAPVGVTRNLFEYGTRVNLQVRLSEKPYFDLWEDPSSLAWQVDGLTYGDWSIESSTSLSVKMTDSLAHNGTMYAHLFMYVDTWSPDPSSSLYNIDKVVYTKTQLNQYRRRPRIAVQKNLVTGEGFDEATLEMERKAKKNDAFISYWSGNLSLAIVTDQTTFKNNIPANLIPHYQFEPASGNYYPVLFVNDFWTLSEHTFPINETITELPLNIDVSAMSFTKWAIYIQMSDTLRQQESMGVSGTADEFKQMLIDNNPLFLLLTFSVSILHSVFDFLAFKNDVAFWKNKQNLEGLSLRTIFVDLASQIIILFYLLDNETSWMILFSVFVGIIIEAWKIPRAFHVTRSSTFPFIHIKDRQSYSASHTKEYDEQAYKFLGIASIPLLIGYAVYSVMYNSHKSWYSFVLATLVGFVYTFGFIKMTPQLFINYKLKTVAHMPWRAFTYKALNTVIDDLFAFVIRMPLMHRLACFRDDVIFVIYLYQRYIYPVDKTRVNEFGQSGAETTEATETEEDETKEVETKDESTETDEVVEEKELDSKKND